jgi:putative ABC transport system permease protein
MVESVLLIVLGGLLGMGLASVVMPVVSASSNGIINLPGVPAQTWAMALGLMVVIGIVVGLLPALRAQRLKIVDALAGR